MPEEPKKGSSAIRVGDRVFAEARNAWAGIARVLGDPGADCMSMTAFFGLFILSRGAAADLIAAQRGRSRPSPGGRRSRARSA
jgi:hypothetical protein